MTAGAAAYPCGRDETAHRVHVRYERLRYQQMCAGSWAPFTATGPIVEHLALLRQAGMTQAEIARKSGVSVTTISRAPKSLRMTSAAADSLLAVQPARSDRSDRSDRRDDGRRATQALRSLVADGWTLQQLADATGLTTRTVGRTVNGHTTSTLGSAAAVLDALERLRLDDPGDGAAAVRARDRAARAGWDPATPTPTATEVDDVAVDAAVAGRLVPLRPAEQQAALQRLAGRYPDTQISRRLGVSARTVLRHRISHGLPAYQRAARSSSGPVW